MPEVFSFNRISTKVLFDVTVACEIQFHQAAVPGVRVEIEGESDDFSVREDATTVYISQKSSGSSTQNMTVFGNGNVSISGISGGSVISTGGATYINSGSGKVFVNGVEITTSADGKPLPKPPMVKVFCNAMLHAALQAKLSAMSTLQSKIKFTSAFIEASGSSDIALCASSLEIVARGSVDANVEVAGGELEINCSGSADINATGYFSRVSVNLSGSADIVTTGKCNGDYRAIASGAGSIRHHGEVLGRIRESCAGTATIRI